MRSSTPGADWSRERLHRLLASLSPADLITFVFLLGLTALLLIYREAIPSWGAWSLVNVAVIVLVGFLARSAARSPSRLTIGLHRWYLCPLVLFVYKELYVMIRPIHPEDYDWLLIQIDYWMFGVNPTQWLASLATPLLTEILQIAYSSYYLLFIVVGVEIYRRRSLQDFDRAAFLIVFGFFLSYIGYFLLPAVGPRFTLHDFQNLDQELPGLLFTKPLRAFVNFGESIPSHVANPIDYVQRDVFPSGHTQLTLVAIYLGFANRVSTRWALAVVGTLLIIGTVYLRYHYVIDIIAGFFFFWLTVWAGHRVERWWNSVRKRLRQGLPEPDGDAAAG